MDFKSLLLFVWLSATITVAAQTDFAPLGSFWNYHYSSHSGDYKAYETILVIKDTSINGHSTRFLQKNIDVYYAFPPNSHGKYSYPFGYISIINDSVYDMNGKYLFSFVMQLGDSIPIFPEPVNLYAIVDSVYEIISGSDTLTKWELTKYCDGAYFGSTSVIEGIGPVDDYLFWNTDGCPIGGGGRGFLCFSSPTIKYNEPCEPIIVGIEPAAEDQTFKLFPNPADDQLRIIGPVPFKEVIIYNQLGQHLKTFNFPLRKQTVINLHELTSGLYIILIKGDEVAHSKSFLIQR